MKTCCGIHGPNYPAGCAAVCPAGECPREEEVRATVETATSSRFHMSESILLLIHYPFTILLLRRSISSKLSWRL